jgi:hypothetical protein
VHTKPCDSPLTAPHLLALPPIATDCLWKQNKQCLGYVAPMGVSLACTMWCFYGLNYAIAYACLYDTSKLASMI